MDEAPEGLIDLHSHLIPGVDDGAPTVEDALEGIGRLLEEGIRTVVTTPHLEVSLAEDPDAFEDRLTQIDDGWNRLSEAVADAFPEMDLRRGAEVMLDVPDPDLSDGRIRLDGTRFVLVEWPRLQIPPSTVPVVERIVENGFRPLVAHPERYAGVAEDIDLMLEWKRAGAYLQVNHGSLVGRYGADARRNARKLLRLGWADVLATDFHGRPQLRLYKAEASDHLEDLGGSEQWEVLTRTNPQRILEDRLPLPVSGLSEGLGLWTRVKQLLDPSGGRSS